MYEMESSQSNASNYKNKWQQNERVLQQQNIIE
jgi:hypothetical protein